MLLILKIVSELDLSGNPFLKPEKGFKRGLSLLYKNSQFEAKFSAFSAKLWNYVQWLNFDGQLMPINQKKVSQDGYELSASYRIFGFELFGQFLFASSFGRKETFYSLQSLLLEDQLCQQ